jgi:hypothetical protein
VPSPTPWKKSRTLGDVYGGRTRAKFADNIFNRAHSLTRPGVCDELPIMIQDNPSRDFFFPLTAEEVLAAIDALPREDVEGITHIWLRRIKKSDYIDQVQPLAWFICGSGVRLITLFPWPSDMILRYGSTKPSKKKIAEAEKFGAKIEKIDQIWVSRWTLEGVRKFYVQKIIYHEVGHHIDWYNRSWSKANRNQVEEFANQYAIAMTANATHVYDNFG